MAPGVFETPFVHVRNIITKIVLLTRLFRETKADVVLYSKSYAVQLVAFIAAYASNKTLNLVDSTNDIGKAIMEGNISIILLDVGTHFDIRPFVRNPYCNSLQLIASIHPHYLLDIKKNFDFIFPRAIENKFEEVVNALLDSDFKDESKFFMEHNQPKIGAIPLLTINHEGETVTYSRSNIWHMLIAIDSEFKNESEGIVSMGKTHFKETFAYALYFFLRGDVLDVLSHDSYFKSFLFSNRKLKHKMLVNGFNFSVDWHAIGKFVFFNRVNRLLRRWRLTRWITSIGYTKAFRWHMLTPNDEYIIINHQRTRTSLEFLKRVRRKVSFIFGTYADGYTLAINRYDDKEPKIENSEFRIMGKSIKVELNTINQLFLGGERIPSSLRTKLPVNVKDRKDRYHLTEYYCEVDGEVISVRANSEDLYFEDEGNTIIDVGTKRRSLMEIPYLMRVDVLKHGNTFKCVVALDKLFIKTHFENPTLSDVKARLREKVEEINADFAPSEKIGKIVVLDKFFDEYDSVSHIISKKDYVKLLNQSPSNLGGPGSG